MRVNIETLQIKISKLRQLVAECPAPGDVREEIKEILEVAPDMLQIAEDAIQSNDPLVLGHIRESLKKIEIDIEWAVGTVKGERTVQSIKEGTSTSPELPAIERLNNRLMTFMMGIIEQKEYLAMFEEFGGEVEGQTAYMDPGEETEAFSQWLIYDKKMLETTDVIIKRFAQKEMNSLPSDELSLLNAYLKNWPSIFQVVNINKKKNIYTVKDLLSDRQLKFRDKATSKTLVDGSIFIGRAIPFNVGDNLYYPLGKILALPEKLWKILSDYISQWSKDFFSTHPGASSQDFFRSYNAQLRRKILEVTGKKEDSFNKNKQQKEIDPQKLKIASEIDAFVKNLKKLDQHIIGSPDILEYMTKFRTLMDTSIQEELDYLSAKYEGFYEFAQFLENFASAIQNGDFDDQL